MDGHGMSRADPAAYRQAGDHADQMVRSGNAPYNKGKTIYCVRINFLKEKNRFS
jgi:hypothetical protein